MEAQQILDELKWGFRCAGREATIKAIIKDYWEIKGNPIESKTIHSPLDLADRAGRRKPMTSTPKQNLTRGNSETAPTEPSLTIPIEETPNAERFK